MTWRASPAKISCRLPPPRLLLFLDFTLPLAMRELVSRMSIVYACLNTASGVKPRFFATDQTVLFGSQVGKRTKDILARLL